MQKDLKKFDLVTRNDNQKEEVIKKIKVDQILSKVKKDLNRVRL